MRSRHAGPAKEIYLDEIIFFIFSFVLLRHLFWFTWQLSRISWTCDTGNEQCKFRQNIKWFSLKNCSIRKMRLKRRLVLVFSFQLVHFALVSRIIYIITMKFCKHFKLTAFWPWWSVYVVFKIYFNLFHSYFLFEFANLLLLYIYINPNLKIWYL